MRLVLESPMATDPIPSVLKGRGVAFMEPKLTLRPAEPVHRDDPIPFPGRDAAPVARWHPRLTQQQTDPTVRDVEAVLERMDGKLRELGRILDENDDDDDRPRAA